MTEFPDIFFISRKFPYDADLFADVVDIRRSARLKGNRIEYHLNEEYEVIYYPFLMRSGKLGLFEYFEETEIKVYFFLTMATLLSDNISKFRNVSNIKESELSASRIAGKSPPLRWIVCLACRSQDNTFAVNRGRLDILFYDVNIVRLGLPDSRDLTRNAYTSHPRFVHFPMRIPTKSRTLPRARPGCDSCKFLLKKSAHK